MNKKALLWIIAAVLLVIPVVNAAPNETNWYQFEQGWNDTIGNRDWEEGSPKPPMTGTPKLGTGAALYTVGNVFDQTSNYANQFTSLSVGAWINISGNGLFFDFATTNDATRGMFEIQYNAGNVECITNDGSTRTVSAAVSTGAYTHIGCVVENGQAMRLYINGTETTGPTIGTMSVASTSNWIVGVEAGVGNWGDFLMDDLRVYLNQTLDASDFLTLYNNGDGIDTFLNSTGVFDTYNLGMEDLNDQSSLLEFTVTIFNSTFSVTNTTTDGNLGYSNLGGIMTANFSAILDNGGYFNQTNIVLNTSNVTTSVAAFQTYLVVDATEVVTNNPINDFTSCVSGTCDTASSFGDNGAAELLLGAGNISIVSEADTITQYLNNTQGVTLLPKTNVTQLIQFYTNFLSINASNAFTGQKINQFTIDLSGLNRTFTETKNTTTGTVNFSLLFGQYNVSFSAPEFARTNTTITLDGPTGFDNLTISAFFFNSVNFTVLDEILGRGNPLFVGRTVNFEITSNTFGQNFTTTDATLFVNLTAPEEYRVTYSSDDYTQRDFYFTLRNETHEEFELYLLSTSNSTDVTFLVKDNNGNTLQDSLVRLKRFYIDTNSYRTVSMCRTNANGECVINTDFNDAFYETFTQFGDVSRTTLGTRIISLTFNIVLQLFADPFQTSDAVENTVSSLTFNEITQTFSYIFSSDTSRTGTVVVSKVGALSDTVVCSESDTSSSATILCAVNTTADTGKYVANGFIIVGNDTILLETEEVNTGLISQAKDEFDTQGVMMSIMIAGSLAGLGAFAGPTAVIIMFLSGLALIVMLGFSTISVSTYVTIALIGGIIIWKLKS